MNIPVLILLLAALTAVFAYIFRKFMYFRWCRPLCGLLLCISIAAILASTILRREVRAEAFVPSMIPFDSYRKFLNGGNPELLRSCFMNAVLFYPAGLLSAVMLPGKWNPVARIMIIGIILTLMSTGIEYAQYAYALGQPEVDDVIHNALGAIIGSGIGCLITTTRSEDS